MNLFLWEVSKKFPQNTILMCCDGAAWHKSGTLEVDSGVLAQNSNETKFNLYINDVVKISHSNKGSYSNNVFSEQLQVEAGDVIKVQMKSGKSGVEGVAIFVCLHFIE